ncbi:MAG: protein-L-isoaspartate(D-aspartate) O-methyltransferase [Gammaproteobacteria bacterium]
MQNILTLLEEIKQETALTAIMTGRETLNERVLKAICKVPRDKFIPSEYKRYAFCNSPLPIGHGQTISQPYIVALMSDLLDLKPEAKVLEIGTGSGYQAAILSLLAKEVYTVEAIKTLSEQAAACFKTLHYSNIKSRVGNGYEGWPEHAPYDGIIVTAAATHIPETLVRQLKPDGRLVIPVGLPYRHQELMLLIKQPNGQTEVKKILDVAFVPLVDYREANH